MAKAEATVEELVSRIERGQLRLPEMQRRYVWRSPRVRDLLDSLYRGYPSGAILLWETNEEVPLQDFAVAQQNNPYQNTQRLLDGRPIFGSFRVLTVLQIEKPGRGFSDRASSFLRQKFLRDRAPSGRTSRVPSIGSACGLRALKGLTTVSPPAARLCVMHGKYPATADPCKAPEQSP